MFNYSLFIRQGLLQSYTTVPIISLFKQLYKIH